MESGKISSWKVQQGDKFSAGDVLLTVETDKAEVDVEAQDDGVMGKIILDEKESSITVGKTIALLAEEGDDISNLSVPESSSSASSKMEEKPLTSSSSSSSFSSSSSSEKPAAAEEKISSPSSSPVKASDSHGHGSYTHPRGLLPSVLRLLTENSVPSSEVEQIPATGKRGALTKSDVLVYLGQAEAKEEGLNKYLEWSHKKMEIFQTPAERSAGKGAAQAQPKEKAEVMSGDDFRRSILAGLARPRNIRQAAAKQAATGGYSFDDILEGYLPPKGAQAKVDPKLVQAANAGRQPPRDAFSEILGL